VLLFATGAHRVRIYEPSVRSFGATGTSLSVLLAINLLQKPSRWSQVCRSFHRFLSNRASTRHSDQPYGPNFLKRGVLFSPNINLGMVCAQYISVDGSAASCANRVCKFLHCLLETIVVERR
jgi:hypothetical protein